MCHVVSSLTISECLLTLFGWQEGHPGYNFRRTCSCFTGGGWWWKRMWWDLQSEGKWLSYLMLWVKWLNGKVSELIPLEYRWGIPQQGWWLHASTQMRTGFRAQQKWSVRDPLNREARQLFYHFRGTECRGTKYTAVLLERHRACFRKSQPLYCGL